jgi:hypothetical protein
LKFSNLLALCNLKRLITGQKYMKLRQNESFLRISKKSHQVWYSE